MGHHFRDFNCAGFVEMGEQSTYPGIIPYHVDHNQQDSEQVNYYYQFWKIYSLEVMYQGQRKNLNDIEYFDLPVSAYFSNNILFSNFHDF